MVFGTNLKLKHMEIFVQIFMILHRRKIKVSGLEPIVYLGVRVFA